MATVYNIIMVGTLSTGNFPTPTKEQITLNKLFHEVKKTSFVCGLALPDKLPTIPVGMQRSYPQ